jgi:hypothetical protein
VYYLVRFKVRQPADVEDVADREDVYVAPEGDRGWTVLEVEDEEDLRRTVEGQDVEEVQPVLLAREYIAISRARRELEEFKARFVDDPSGALEDARQAVGRALEGRGYPSLERANEASGSRQEVLREYQATDPEGSGSLEDTRTAFNRLSELLDRIART